MLPSSEHLVRHVERHRGLKTRALAQQLEVADAEQDDFFELLLRLQVEGSLVRLPEAGWDIPERTDHRVGSLQLARGGQGYVRFAPGTIREEDLFVRPADLSGALDGDMVLVRLEPRKRGDGTPDRLREARVLDVVRRTRRPVRGTLSRLKQGALFAPTDSRSELRVFIPDEALAGAEDGDRVLVRVLDGPLRGGQARGKVVARLEDEGTYATDLRMVRELHDLSGEHSAQILAQAEALARPQPGAPWPGRVDLRGSMTFTIDPVDARDYDDAVSLEELPGGALRLGVHIADVSHYIPSGSQLDREAERRSTSVYLPGTVIPMLPERLSNDLCSLRPDEDRLTKTVRITYTASGKVRETEVFRSIIRSRRRFTYEEVLAILDYLDSRKPSPGLPADHVKFEGVLGAMARLRDRLHAARYERGAIYLDLPKLRLTLDDDMEVAELARDSRDPSHTLIEEFMLAANEAVAHYLVDKHLPLVARVHPPPEERKLKEFRSFLQALGVHAGGKDAAVLKAVQRGDSGYFQRLIAKVADEPLSPVIQLALLRTMGHAEYVLGAGLHFALATTRYCHFTSPIRRYPDLLVHQILDEHFDGMLAKATRRRDWDARLSHAAEHASELERRAEEAEREMTQLRLLRYLKPRIGEEMDARIVSVHPFGFFVRNEETLIEGLVHVSSLDDDFYEHDRDRHSLRGRRHRRRFAVGDRVRVELADVDFDRRSVSFRFVRKLKGA